MITHSPSDDNDLIETDSPLEMFGKTLLMFAARWENEDRLKKEYEEVTNYIGNNDIVKLVTAYAIAFAKGEITEEDTATIYQIKERMLVHHYPAQEFIKISNLLVKDSDIREVFLLMGDDQFEKKHTIISQQQRQKFANNSVSKEKLTAEAEKLNSTDEWKCFLPLSNSISTSWNSNQEKWGKLCLAAVELSLKENFNTALEAYQWLGHARFQIANILLHLGITNQVFGRMRSATLDGLTATFMTDIANSKGSKYQDQYADCNFLLMALEQNKDSASVKHQSIKFDWKGKEITIDITSIIDLETKASLSSFFRSHCQGHQAIRICHPPASRCFTIFDHHIEPLYQKLLATKDEQNIYCLIGEITYYLGQLAALEGGSTATSDMFIRRAMKEKGIPLLSYQKNLNWDLEAIFHPDPKKYATEYQNLFAQPQASLSCKKSY